MKKVLGAVLAMLLGLGVAGAWAEEVAGLLSKSQIQVCELIGGHRRGQPLPFEGMACLSPCTVAAGAH